LTLAEWVFSFSNMGMRNAAVFPEPVLAMATTSLPSITRGIHCMSKGHFSSQLLEHCTNQGSTVSIHSENGIVCYRGSKLQGICITNSVSVYFSLAICWSELSKNANSSSLMSRPPCPSSSLYTLREVLTLL